MRKLTDLLTSLMLGNIKEVETKFKSVDVLLKIKTLSDGRKSIYLSDFVSNKKGNGDGGEFMQNLTAFSDSNNIPISLFAYTEDKDLDRLISFYKRLGFSFRYDPKEPDFFGNVLMVYEP